MVKSEVCKLLAVIAATYSKFEVDELKQNVWYEMLQDIPYEVAQLAIKKHILESVFPPTIADVRKNFLDIITPQDEKQDAGGAWGDVMNAVRLFGYYEPQKALESLKPLARKTAKYISWNEICLSENLGVVRGQFIKIYDTLLQREKQDNLLPQGMKLTIEGIANQFKLSEQQRKEQIIKQLMEGEE